MDWANERYVRLYTRDTPGWLMMSWQARATLALLLRKFDRAGLIDLAEFAGDDAAAVVAEMVKLPVDVVSVGLADLLKRQTLVVRGRFLVMPNFIEAQETSQSDKMRKAEQRARARERAMSHDVSHDGHAESQEVTGCHAVQNSVTPSLAVPSLAKPIGTAPQAAPTQLTVTVKKERGCRLPDGWEPTPTETKSSWHQIARSRGLTAFQVDEAKERFKDHWRAAAGQRGVKLDWEATWRNWLRGTNAAPAFRPRGDRDFGRPVDAKPFDWDAKARVEREERRKQREREEAAAKATATLELNAKRDVALAQLAAIGGNK